MKLPARDAPQPPREPLRPRRERDGHAPSSRDAVLVAGPSSTDALDVNSDVEQLVRLSRSLF